MAITDYDFSLTRSEIISQAFRKIGALALGEQLSSEQADQGVELLNLIAKEWQNDNVFLWTQEVKTVSLVIADADYLLSAIATDNNILSVDRAYLRQSGKDHPLDVLSWRDYQDISSKTDTGTPDLVSLDVKNSTLYVWPVPTVADTLLLLLTMRMKDLDSASATGDFPPKWHKALVWSLAAELAAEYLIPRLERANMVAEAQYYYQRAKRADDIKSDASFVRGSYEE